MQGDLSQRRPDLQLDFRAVRDQDQALGVERLSLLQGCQPAGALGPVVAAEHLIDHEVAQRLAERAVRHRLQQCPLLGGDVQGVVVLKVARRAGKREARRRQRLDHGREVGRSPMAVQEFVDEVVRVLALDTVEPVDDQRVVAAKGGIGRQEPFDELERALEHVELAAAGGAREGGMLDHQVADRRERSPSRYDVVTVVEDAADLELAANEVGKQGLVLGRNPAPDAVHANEIEIRQISPVNEIGKGFVEQLHVDARRGTQLMRKAYLRRIEIGTPPFSGRCRGMEIDAEALPEAQLAGCAEPGRRQASHQQRQPRYQWIELLVVGVGVFHVGQVAVSPVAHRYVSQRSRHS